MTHLADKLAAYAASLKFEDLPPEVVHQAKRLMVDTLGCALGGYDSEQSIVTITVATSPPAPTMAPQPTTDPNPEPSLTPPTTEPLPSEFAPSQPAP